MPRMGAATIVALRTAVTDPTTVARYWSHVLVRGEAECWPWTGAIAGNGHGRFQLSDTYLTLHNGQRRRVTFVVIAHRFGYALANGVEPLLRVPILAHKCDNPLCQNGTHWRASDHSANRRDYLARRATVLGPLADIRGARGRARAVRDAARAGNDIGAAELNGAHQAHRAQLPLFDEPTRVYTQRAVPVSRPDTEDRASGAGQGQPTLFDVGES